MNNRFLKKDFLQCTQESRMINISQFSLFEVMWKLLNSHGIVRIEKERLDIICKELEIKGLNLVKDDFPQIGG